MMLETEKRLIENYTGKISEEKLSNILFDLGMEIENSEGKLKIDIGPDRPDLVSTPGVARAIKNYLGKKTTYSAQDSKKKVIIENSVKNIRPFTACAIIRGLKFDDDKIKEVIDIQEKLHSTFGRNRKKIAIGIYPLEKIKPPIYFRALNPDKIKFIPLEFNKEMTGSEILRKHPAGREYAHLLEGKNKYPIFIDSNKNILSMPPIINSELTGKITEKTTDILIECSGHNFEVLKKTLNILAAAFADMGGKICSMELQYDKKKIITPDFSPEKMKLNVEDVNKVLGLDLKESDVKTLLERAGYGYKSGIVYIPAYRTDIWHEVDLIDDIARVYGFNNFKPRVKPVFSQGEELKEKETEDNILDIMTGLGFQETLSLALTNKTDQFLKMNIPEQEHIEIKTSKEKALNMLRVWLLPETLKTLSNNRDKELPQKIFEIEDIVLPDEKLENRAKNIKKLAVCIMHTNTNFTEIKQILDCLMNALGKNFNIEETSHGSFIEGRTGKIIFNDKEIGIIGELHPKVLTNLGLEFPVSALELDVEELDS